MELLSPADLYVNINLDGEGCSVHSRRGDFSLSGVRVEKGALLQMEEHDRQIFQLELVGEDTVCLHSFSGVNAVIAGRRLKWMPGD